MPFVQSVAEQLGVKHIEVTDTVSNNQLCNMVGNLMHAACVGLSLVAGIMLSDPV